MMEEVGYMAELMARGPRPTSEENDEANLMQGTKRSLPPSCRRRSLEEDINEQVLKGEEATSSTNIPGTSEGRSTREDPTPREEDLTAEDWAVMDAVERCPVWRALKTFNLRQREKLLAAMCLVNQESVEGNADRPTIHDVEDFRDWGRRWGQDDPEAQLLLRHQWDNLLRHVMGITAAMEVWDPSTASSSGETAPAMDRPLSNPTGESTNTAVNGLLKEEGLPHNSTNAAHASEQCGAERERR